MSLHKPISDYTLTWKELVAQKPKFVNDKKKRLWSKMEEVQNDADASSVLESEQSRFTRWTCPRILPQKFSFNNTVIVCHKGLYTYGDARVDSLISTSLRYFHVNFADANLFGFYGGSLLAQDELQVLEIPMLAQWRERLLKDKSMAAEARTMDNVGCTPAVITNVPRLGSLDTGEMGELYGNNFRVASFDDVNKHFEIAKSLRVAPRANVIAMVAARGSRGKYTASDVKFLLETCCAAFDGATRVVKQDELVGIHTGFWGCGAFGGNRTMSILGQLCAANICRVVGIVFHSVDDKGEAIYNSAMKLYQSQIENHKFSFDEIIDKLASLGLEWGVGDGT